MICTKHTKFERLAKVESREPMADGQQSVPNSPILARSQIAGARKSLKATGLGGDCDPKSRPKPDDQIQPPAGTRNDQSPVPLGFPYVPVAES
jgi:hypothetical protein